MVNINFRSVLNFSYLSTEGLYLRINAILVLMSRDLNITYVGCTFLEPCLFIYLQFYFTFVLLS